VAHKILNFLDIKTLVCNEDLLYLTVYKTVEKVFFLSFFKLKYLGEQALVELTNKFVFCFCITYKLLHS
jgi:hypothetical protein